MKTLPNKDLSFKNNDNNKQNCFVKHTNKFLGYMLSKIFKNILAFFSNLFFGTISKMFNIIKLTVIFKIIYYLVIFVIY